MRGAGATTWWPGTLAALVSACAVQGPPGQVDGGSPEPAACALPRQLDFGALALGDSSTRSVALVNGGAEAIRVGVGAITSAGADAAAFAPGLPGAPGELEVAPGATEALSITFTPTEERNHLALLRVAGAEGCSDRSIVLFGDAVAAVLTWQPRPLDFGYRSPGSSGSGELVLSNLSAAPVTLSGIAATTADFGVWSGTGELVVPAATVGEDRVRTPGTAALPVLFTPQGLGPRAGAIQFSSGLPRQATNLAKLRGVGGGPDIDVSPAPALDFGKVAYFAGAPLFTVRKLLVRNAGTRPSPADAAWNLRLGKQGAAPYWEVQAGPGSSLDELCVGAWDEGGARCLGTLPAYQPAMGLVAEDPGARLELPVRLAPTGLGLKSWKVTIFSNDPDEPSVEVLVTAEVRAYPPCALSVSPLALSFGLIAPPAERTLEVAVRNRGAGAGDVCLVSGADLAPGSSEVFSLAGGPPPSRELAPGEELRIPVRARPASAGSGVVPVTGALRLFVSSPSSPAAAVPLRASLGHGCLVISPRGLDFGTVQRDCSSPARTFSVYNVCAAGVTVTGFEMSLAAGQPAGGPGCAGAAPCPELFAVDTAGIAPSTVIAPGAAPATFSLKYHPIDLGADTGAFTLHLSQGGVAVDEVLVLQGEGAASGANTDVFSSSSGKADVLLVIDDSCSMSDRQGALAANAGAFFKYANAQGIDWQVGVTTTDMSSPLRQGRLVGDSSNPKVLTPVTPNVLSLFASKVNVGINGSATEVSAAAATAALTPPLIGAENAGLVRPDASLGVVILTDARDQSPQPVSYYVSALLGVKGGQRADLFSYSALVPTLGAAPSGCSYDDGSAASYPFHQQMVGALGGMIGEVCSAADPLVIEALGTRAFRTNGSYSLTAFPDTSQPITLQLDGVAVPAVDGSGVTLWSYDAVTNSVGFTPASKPGQGQTVQIDYQVACLP